MLGVVGCSLRPARSGPRDARAAVAGWPRPGPRAATLLLAGMGLQSGWSLITVKLVLIFLFLMITSPTASHATARAAIAAELTPKLDPRAEPEGRG